VNGDGLYYICGLNIQKGKKKIGQQAFGDFERYQRRFAERAISDFERC
jgi:hypothetical protein